METIAPNTESNLNRFYIHRDGIKINFIIPTFFSSFMEIHFYSIWVLHN